MCDCAPQCCEPCLTTASAWLHAGLCGFSMGGVHACITASLYPGPLAVVPLLAPRSASAAFVYGALREATAWRPLAESVDEARRVRFPP